MIQTCKARVDHGEEVPSAEINDLTSLFHIVSSSAFFRLQIEDEGRNDCQ